MKRIQSVTVRSPYESKAELAKGVHYSLVVGGRGLFLLPPSASIRNQLNVV